MTNSPQNLIDVQSSLAEAAREAGRNEGEVTLIAVTKTHEPNHIRPVLEAGHRVFGENRVQEAATKWPALREEYGDIELHLIGPLQTNKVRDAVQIFDVIESVDREKLARKLASEMGAQGRNLQVFLQVNTGEEPQKSGVFPADIDDFVNLCRDELGLDVAGLMAIPPVGEEAALHFALLAKLARRNGLEALSMGMSSDYETAVMFGATHIRVGTAIFGTRKVITNSA